MFWDNELIKNNREIVKQSVKLLQPRCDECVLMDTPQAALL